MPFIPLTQNTLSVRQSKNFLSDQQSGLHLGTSVFNNVWNIPWADSNMES